MESPPKTFWRISARDKTELFSQFGSLGIRVLSTNKHLLDEKARLNPDEGTS
jgi:hypothetical protein